MSGILAQLGEHLPYKQRVTGSSPVGPISIVYGSQCLRTPFHFVERSRTKSFVRNLDYSIASRRSHVKRSFGTFDECRCGSTAEQLICNQQVISSNLIIG